MRIRKWWMFCLLSFALMGCAQNESAETGAAGETATTEEAGVAEDTADYQEVLKEAEEGFEQIRQKSYDNLNLEHAYLMPLSDVSGLYELHLQQETVDFEVFLACFEDAVEALWGDDVDEQYFYVNPVNERDIPRPAGQGDGLSEAGRLLYPLLYDSLSRIREENIPVSFLMYQTDQYGNTDADKYLLAFSNLTLFKMNKCELMRSVEQERQTAGWMPWDNFNIEKTYTPDSENVYMLKDGECSVREAAEFTEKYFKEDFTFAALSDMEAEVQSVNLMETEPGVYAYLLYLSRAYEGVAFDSRHYEGAGTQPSDGNTYDFDSSEALMYRINDIEYYWYTSMDKNIVSKEPIEQILSLERSLDKASGHLSAHLTFDLYGVQLVYSNRIVDSEEGTSVARPAWKFELYCSNDAKVYYVYVDAETGDVYHYSLGA